MTELKNDLLLRALCRQPVERTPVWIMRQAGRYLPEYLKTRAEAGSFMKLCQTPELACEVTLQPLRRFALDAAIIFSDILTIPDAMGLGLHFVTGEGPRFERPLESSGDIRKLPRPDVADSLAYVMDAVALTRRELVSETVTDYLNAQISSGAQAVQIFDTWGGALAAPAYREFSLQYMERIVGGLQRENEGRPVPVILFSKGCNTQLEALAETGCDALGVDWTITLQEARQRVGGRVALQGNLDPAVLLAEPGVVRREALGILESYGHGNGHVFNLGHGITPDVNPDHLAALVDAVRDSSPAFHA
jgi:uroporphyrinogen decarboxylase